jgi:hypothetical protein
MALPDMLARSNKGHSGINAKATSCVCKSVATPRQLTHYHCNVSCALGCPRCNAGNMLQQVPAGRLHAGLRTLGAPRRLENHSLESSYECMHQVVHSRAAQVPSSSPARLSCPARLKSNRRVFVDKLSNSGCPSQKACQIHPEYKFDYYFARACSLAVFSCCA